MQLLVYARHAVSEGTKFIMIKANDTNVLVIGVNVLSGLMNIGLKNFG
jgi:hypothetical protein